MEIGITVITMHIYTMTNYYNTIVPKIDLHKFLSGNLQKILRLSQLYGNTVR